MTNDHWTVGKDSGEAEKAREGYRINVLYTITTFIFHKRQILLNDLLLVRYTVNSDHYFKSLAGTCKKTNYIQCSFTLSQSKWFY